MMTNTTDPATEPLASAPASYPELRGRTVLITGAAAGLGRGMATAFGRQGARLFLVDIDTEALASTAEALRANGVTVATGVASVADPKAVDAAFDAALERYGTIAVLLNNAGIAMNKPTLELSLADWQRTLDVNLTGAFLCAKAQPCAWQTAASSSTQRRCTAKSRPPSASPTASPRAVWP